MANFIVSAEHAVKVLNEAFALDPDAIKNILAPVRINDALANHPTIQIQSLKSPFGGDDPEKITIFSMTVIGLLNGIFGVDENGQGPIARIIEDGQLAGFCVNTNLAADAEPMTIGYCQHCDKALSLYSEPNPITWCMPCYERMQNT